MTKETAANVPHVQGNFVESISELMAGLGKAVKTEYG